MHAKAPKPGNGQGGPPPAPGTPLAAPNITLFDGPCFTHAEMDGLTIEFLAEALYWFTIACNLLRGEQATEVCSSLNVLDA